MKPCAWLHILDTTEGIEGNEPRKWLTFRPDSPFGVPGVDYSAEFPVVTIPLYQSEHLLTVLKEFHSDVVSLVETIEEVEADGGQSYDTVKTRRLLGLIHQFLDKADSDVMLT